MDRSSLVVALSLALHLTVTLAFLVTLALERRRSRRVAPRTQPLAHVTILKPLAGADDELAENLASLAALDHPSFEVLFGVASTHDPAHAVAHGVLRAHPLLRGRVIVTDRDAATNPKVAQLLGLVPHASGDVLVVSDSNVRVAPDYLRAMQRALDDTDVGLVTSLVAGTGERSMGAALENLQWGAFVTPLVALSDKLCTLPITVGKSMAFRRVDAERLDLFARVSDVLAEDHLMGRIFHDAGMLVRTSFHRIENRNVRAGLRLTWERHARWMKMRRAIAPWPFVFEPLLTPVTMATATLAFAPLRTALAWWALASLTQMATATVTTRAIRGTFLSLRYLPLEIVRSYVGLACWLRAWASRRVSWRGHAFLLGKDSRIVPLRPRARPEAFARS